MPSLDADETQDGHEFTGGFPLDGCVLLLLIILVFALIRGYWYQANRRTTPFALLALLLFVLPLLFTFQKFVALDRFAPRSQKLFADNPEQITAIGLIISGRYTVSGPLPAGRSVCVVLRQSFRPIHP